MIIYLIRHGQSNATIENCYGGIADFSLSQLGIDQAVNISEKLQKLGLEVIFTSPLIRAFETSKIIQGKLQHEIPIEIINNLKERNSYGVLSGSNKNLSKSIFKQIIESLKEDPEFSQESILGSEDFSIFVGRVELAFNEIIKESKMKGYNNILIVGHGKFLQTLLVDVLMVCKEFDYSFGKIFRLNYSYPVVEVKSLK